MYMVPCLGLSMCGVICMRGYPCKLLFPSPCRVAGTVWVSRELGHQQDPLLSLRFCMWQIMVFLPESVFSAFLVPEVSVCCVFVSSSFWFHTVEEVLWGFLCSSRCPGIGESCTGQ